MPRRKKGPRTIEQTLSEGPIDLRCESCGKTNTFDGQNDKRPYISCECGQITVLSESTKQESIDATYERLRPYITRG